MGDNLDYFNKRKEDKGLSELTPNTLLSEHERDSDMIHNHIARLTHLETIQKIHANSILSLDESMKALTDQFKQVKWGIYGGLFFFVGHQIGFDKLIEKLFT